VSLFSGLGLGLGEIGAQVGRGALLGQQRELQQMQLQRQMDFRNAQLQAMMGYRQGQLGLRAAGLQQRAQLPYLHALANPAMAGYFARNPGDRAAWEARAGLNPQVDPSALPPDPNLDPATGTLRAPTGQTFGPGGEIAGAGGAAGGPGAAPPPPSPDMPPPSLTLPSGIAGIGPAGAGQGPGLTLPPDLSGVGAPPPPPPPSLFSNTNLQMPASVQNVGQPPHFALGGVTPRPTPIGPPIPAAILNRQAINDVRSVGPGGAPAPPIPSTDTGSAATGTGAAPAALDPTQDPHNPLYAGYLPHETEQGRAQRIGSAAKTLVAQIGASRFAAQYPGLAADSALKGLKLEAYPTEETAKIGGMVAGTNLKQAQQKALETFAPIRDQDLQARIQHVHNADELAAVVADATARYHDQLISLGNRRADIAAAGQQSAAGLNSARINQINTAISQSAGSKDDASDRAILQSGLKAITSTKRTASGASVPFLSPADQATWQQRVDGALARMQARQAARSGGGAPITAPATAAPAARPQRGQPGYNAWLQGQSANPGTVIRQPPAAPASATPSPKAVRVSPEVQNIVGQLITNHQFDAEMAKPEYGDPARRMLMKRAFLQFTGRNWTGGR